MLWAIMFSSIITLVLALLAMAFFTLLERKILGYIHLRKGPNKPGILGLPQPLADAAKLFLKEMTAPSFINMTPFLMAPALALFLALSMWLLYPHISNPLIFILGALLFMSLSSLNVYTSLLAGWVSNSKYSLLGALRSMAQTISYEVSMALILITPFLLNKSLSFSKFLVFSHSKLLVIYILLLMWLVSILAETNRSPFDLAEGESELVSGFNTEYSSGVFAMIFMAEYTNILIMSIFSTALFLPLLLFKFHLLNLMIFMLLSLMVASFFLWARGTLPRIRYDQLMALAWKSFLPMTLAFLVMTLSLSSL